MHKPRVLNKVNLTFAVVSLIQAVSKGLSFLGVRGRGGHRESKKDRKLGSKTYQFQMRSKSFWPMSGERAKLVGGLRDRV